MDYTLVTVDGEVIEFTENEKIDSIQRWINSHFTFVCFRVKVDDKYFDRLIRISDIKTIELNKKYVL